MSSSLSKRSVHLTPETWEKIRQRAASKRMSPSEFIRHAIDAYFEIADGNGANLQRIAELCEFNQLVLDRIVRRDFADYHQPILNAVSDRLATHHGK